MRLRIGVLNITIALSLPATAVVAQTPGKEAQIAGAVSAAPEDRREGATVMGHTDEGELVLLRQGTNELICLADKSGDDRFHAACYHRSLEPYMVRGRELRAEGKDGTESLAIRHQEADAGKLEMPSAPAALYNLGGPIEIFDADSGTVAGGNWVWSVYIPYATEVSTGLPTTPQAPGAPWIMRPGTASSHIMVVQPREEESDE
jgi:hypothetical protein